jgi:hypothetical protein
VWSLQAGHSRKSQAAEAKQVGFIFGKVETYTGVTLDYTITTDATSIYFKDSINDSVGHFKICIDKPASYTGIALFDKVKIYLSSFSLPVAPQFVGRIDRITTVLNDDGWQLEISGMGQGEVLTRLIKRFWRYTTVDAGVVAAEYATDCGLGTGDITADTNDVTFDVASKTYLELLQQIGDYWISAGTQLKKDFHVDVDNDLVWKTRPLRAGTQTLTVGSNILSYQVIRSLEQTRNKIFVLGGFDKPKAGTIAAAHVYTMKVPEDENWTESLTNWTFTTGTGSLDHTVKTPTEGAECIMVGSAQPGGVGTNDICDFKRTLKPDFYWVNGIKETSDNSYAKLYFDAATDGLFTIAKVYALAHDTSNFYEWNINIDVTPTNWEPNTITFNDGSEGVTGSPNWEKIEGFRFYFAAFTGARKWAAIDNLRLLGGRFQHLAEDATSQTDYGRRDLVHLDEALISVADVQTRGETLKYQLKDPTVEVTISTMLNTDILVGDRLTVTLPNEGITAADCDAISVEQSVTNQGGTTVVTTVTSPNKRRRIDKTPFDVLASTRREMNRQANWVHTPS